MANKKLMLTGGGGGGGGGGGATQLFSDNFNRASLGSNWMDAPWADASLQIISSASVGAVAFALSAVLENTQTWPANQYMSAKWLGPAAAYVGVLVRAKATGVTSGDRDFYAAGNIVSEGGTNTSVHLWKSVGGTISVLSTGSGSLSANDLIELLASDHGDGTVDLTVKVGGTTRVTFNDATSPITAAGKPGLVIGHNVFTVGLLDDAAGGSL